MLRDLWRNVRLSFIDWFPRKVFGNPCIPARAAALVNFLNQGVGAKSAWRVVKEDPEWYTAGVFLGRETIKN